MPRRPRSSLDDGAFHVVSRGTARTAIVVDDVDRRAFVALLDLTVVRFEWELDAYCLMTNHFHLVVTATRDRLSRGMHRLAGRHAERFNRRYDRVGHLFQGRYEARRIGSDESLERVCRYVEDNPVRAGICATAEQWPWSSARERAALSRP